MSKCTCASPCGDTEQMVSVPVELAESAVDAFASIGMHDQLERLNELLEQPAAQHQGEPVVLPARHVHEHHGCFLSERQHGWNACLDEIAKLGPLYTHAVTDSGEVERWRGEAARLKTIADNYCALNMDAQQDLIKLRAPLAERDALLRDLVSMDIQRTAAAIERAKQILSVSAEPNQCDGCQAGIPLVNGAHRMGKPVGYADTMSCQAGKYASAEPKEERGSSHGFEQSPNSCRHDERIGVWWREGPVTRTGQECCACGNLKEDPVASAEPSAPVERNERAAFEADQLSKGFAVDLLPGTVATYMIPAVRFAWAGWQARAALERKPE